MDNRNTIANALMRRIDPAASYQLGGQTFRPVSEAMQPTAFDAAPFSMPANLMNPARSVANTPYVPGQAELAIADPSLRQAENERYALQQQMLNAARGQ
jgi:hypothetical protein